MSSELWKQCTGRDTKGGAAEAKESSRRQCDCNQLGSLTGLKCQADSKNGEKGTHSGGHAEAQPS